MNLKLFIEIYANNCMISELECTDVEREGKKKHNQQGSDDHFKSKAILSAHMFSFSIWLCSRIFRSQNSLTRLPMQ